MTNKGVNMTRKDIIENIGSMDFFEDYIILPQESEDIFAYTNYMSKLAEKTDEELHTFFKECMDVYKKANGE